VLKETIMFLAGRGAWAMVGAMKTAYLVAALCWCGELAGVRAQEDTAHHRKVYSEVNEKVGAMKKVKAEYDDDGLIFELEGWVESGTLRKIVARVPGEDGDGSEAYYLEDGKPLFVFGQYRAAAPDGVTGAQMEDRFYFKAGRLFKWLGADKQPVSPDSGDFALEAERLTKNCAHFVQVLGKAAGQGKGKEKAEGKAAAEVMEGTFLGLEEGDYTHWLMRKADGQEVSLFVLRPQASVEKVLEAPAGFVGKRCRVTWKKSIETIPEAGGKMEVEQVLAVEWVKK
jgi:hypothetical protein